LPFAWRVAIVIALVALGVWVCGESAPVGVHDHSSIVLMRSGCSQRLCWPARTVLWFALFCSLEFSTS
jgi:hypothetical protein